MVERRYFFAELSSTSNRHTRRRSDHLGDAVLFHIFRHVYTDNVILLAKNSLCQSLGKLCLANTGWSQEQERSDRTTRDPSDRPCHGGLPWKLPKRLPPVRPLSHEGSPRDDADVPSPLPEASVPVSSSSQRSLRRSRSLSPEAPSHLCASPAPYVSCQSCALTAPAAFDLTGMCVVLAADCLLLLLLELNLLLLETTKLR